MEISLGVPYSHRYDVRCERRRQESFLFFLRYFDTITATEILAAGGAPAGPSMPARAVGGARREMTIHSRGKQRRARAASSSREPSPDDDESDVEAESSQGEAGDDSDSGGDGGDPGPSSRKRTRMDSRI
ncbi:uncharacterized protein LOC114306723 [Camellia sinensis]|uniref:uncharacterized protein LOC114306723 n=1 Tax=Camellia sinensis TaxID=4442 RepID=UPI001035F8BB|nr:uncharacterized protein LOC114306723 [Camellia sinensis]